MSLAREFVRQHLLAHGLAHLVDDVRLVTSELATNAMIHARTPFVVTLSGLDGHVRLTVRDGLVSGPSRATPGAMDLNGRGLVLVERLSDDWGVSADGDGSKSVWASFATRAMPELASVTA
jgi:anti-sigma regulatory factor (Ser/Thr protein kinase)